MLDICEIKERKADYWQVFRKYHYLRDSFKIGSRVWLCYVNGNLAGFCSFLHYPSPFYDNLKKAHRVVVLPDYQGVGIAKTMLRECATQMKKEGYMVTLCSSNSAMIYALKRNPDWKCIRYGRQCKVRSTTKQSLRASNSHNRITCNFEYIGQ